MRVNIIGEFDGLTPPVVDHFFKDPHSHIVFIIRETLTVSSNNVGNGGSPVATPNDADLYVERERVGANEEARV
jgi:hypothetical protein